MWKCNIQRSKVNQTLATIVVTIGVFSLGTVLGWTSPAFPDMLKQHQGKFTNISANEQSWIGSIATLGALASCPIGGISIDNFGRRKTMLLYSIQFSVGWILIGFSSNVWMMCFGRFLSGFCGGIFSLSAPAYIGEIVESHIRGMLMNTFQIMFVSGILFVYAYILGAFVSWQALALISSCIPLISLISLWFIPESPRYLLMQGKLLESQKALCWLRGTTSIMEIHAEMSLVQESVNEITQNSINLNSFLKPNVLKPLAISLMLMILEQASAFNVVIFYCFQIFTAAGTSLDGNWSSIIVGSVQVGATILSTFLVDRFGRRILLLWSEAVMGASFIALGAFFYLKSVHDDAGRDSSSGIASYYQHLLWLPLVSVLAFIVAFAIGIGPLSWTIMGEILHPNIKGYCSAIATSFVWLSAFVVTKIYQSLVQAVGVHWSFWIFSSVSIIGTVLVYFLVPETKGKTLEEIQSSFVKEKKTKSTLT